MIVTVKLEGKKKDVYTCLLLFSTLAVSLFVFLFLPGNISDTCSRMETGFKTGGGLKCLDLQRKREEEEGLCTFLGF